MCEIRRVQDTDLDKLKIICERSFDRPSGAMKFYKRFIDYVNFCRAQNYAYVAVEDGEVCGALLAYEKPDMCYGKNIYIELLAVLPEYQERGYGRKLLNAVKVDAQNNGISELSIRTGCYMDSYQIFKNYGFRDTRDDHRYMIMNIIGNEK